MARQTMAAKVWTHELANLGLSELLSFFDKFLPFLFLKSCCFCSTGEIQRGREEGDGTEFVIS